MMVNFSKISAAGAPGRLLRYVLKLIPGKATVKILQGQARGMKWIVESGDHGYWLGSYEFDKQNRLNQLLRPGMVFFDIGANVGFYSLLASKAVGQGGQVVAFEPNPANLYYLKQHIALNKCHNVIIQSCALSNQMGSMGFDASQSRSMGHLTNEDGYAKVNVATLDWMLASEMALKPDLLKIDVEGEEHNVLLGASETLRRYRPIIFLATHGPEIRQQCLNLLENLDYQFYSVQPMVDYTKADEIIAIYKTISTFPTFR